MTISVTPNTIAASRRIRSLALLTTGLVSCFGAGQATAQTDTPPTYPTAALIRGQQNTIDSNGVNVISTSLTADMPLVSVGDPKFGGLSFNIVYSDAQWSHNFAFVVSDITRSPFDIPSMQPIRSGPRNLPNFKTMVVAENLSDKFSPPVASGQNLLYVNVAGTQGILSTGVISTIFENINKIGDSNYNATLSTLGKYKYISKDGSVYTFSTMGGYNTNFLSSARTSAHPVSLFYAPSQSVQGIVTNITKPSGEIINFYYDLSVSTQNSNSSYLASFVRLRAISNNFGYKIKLNYSNLGRPVIDWRGVPPRDWAYPNSVQAINLKFGSCDNFSNSCSGPQVVAASSLALTPSVGCVDRDFSLNLPFVTTASISVTDPDLKLTKFEMDCHSNLTGIIAPSGRRTTAAYTRTVYSNVDISVSGNNIYKPILYSLSSLTIRGQTYGYSQLGDPLCGLFMGWNTSCPSGTFSIARTNPDGSSVSFGSDRGNSFLLWEKDELNRIVTYNEDAFGRLIKKIFPEQNLLSYEYDSRGNITKVTEVPKSGDLASALVDRFGYFQSCSNFIVCNLPNFRTDQRSQEYDYTYDQASGVLTSITGPSVGGGIRQQQRFSYTALQASYFSPSGSIILSGSPVTLMTGTSECITTNGATVVGTPGVGPFSIVGAASCAGTPDEVISTISYGPQGAGTANNLLPISITATTGDGLTSIVTSTTYDAVGNIASVTDPRLNTSFTVYDALRRKLFEIGANPGDGKPRQIVHHVYDGDGREVRTEIGTGTMADGSDFTLLRFKRMTFDQTTGLLVKVEKVVP